MKVLVNMPGLICSPDGAVKIFTTDGKPTYANGAKPCYYLKELDLFVPVEKCVNATK